MADTADSPPASAQASVLTESRQVALRLENLHKVYDRDVHALRDIGLQISEGEFVTLLGPSGSGKTTLLMVIAGFESPTAGRVVARGVDITAVPPERRNFGIVFQSYALFPHMSVRQNVTYPLAVRRIHGKHRDALVDDVLALVGLEGLGHRRPAQLSGGQQQRVALARALVYKPSMLLLDEPLGALDRALRERMQVELSKLHKRVGVTFLYVTHDQDEALTMSDRVVVLNDGRVEQIGTPEQIYARPVSRFVAGFVGKANLLPGRVLCSNGGLARIQLDCGPAADIPCVSDLTPNSEALVVIRLERVHVVGLQGSADGNSVSLTGRLEQESFAGTVWRYGISTTAGEFHAHMTNRADISVGDIVRVGWNPAEAWAISNDANPREIKME
jgi:putative spermidine/putrescine transport system ATP-binding protein